MDALDKQISRIHQHIRDAVPPEQLRLGLQAINAMRSAAQIGGDDALKRWAKKNLTAEMRAAMVALADADDTRNSSGIRMADMIRLVFKVIDE